jgi:nucleotide-binding universal stress UspA family protein
LSVQVDVGSGQQVDGAFRRLKKLLVPIDFSDASLKAIEYAVPFARHSGGTVHLIHVIERPIFLSDLPDINVANLDANLVKDATAQLLSMANEEIEELIPVQPVVRIGQPFVEILAAAKALNIDLIIMATRGNTGLKHVILGSTAERVVRHAGCPVLVVREREHDFI